MRIFVLEDDEQRLKWFRQSAIGCVLDTTDKIDEAKALLDANTYNQIFLDHDLNDEHYMAYFKGETPNDEETGYAIAQYLAENPDKSQGAEIIIHSLNPAGSERMWRKIKETRRNCHRVSFLQLQTNKARCQ